MMDQEEKIKCVVWDLDNTIWNGVLSEGDSVTLKEDIFDIIKALDSRGILQSISSKNDSQEALDQLQKFGLLEYFLYPEISWSKKSSAIERIQKNLNIALGSMLFIDDQEFELAEVSEALPQVRCFNACNYKALLKKNTLVPRFITDDAAKRRLLYQQEQKRKVAESEYQGPSESFLASLGMKFKIHEASENDLKRAEELTVRTNQLNATGRTYSYEELNEYRISKNHKLLICELEDKFGDYGKIGLVLLELTQKQVQIKMLLMSCRVMSRGVGSVLLNFLIKKTVDDEKLLFADFIDTGRNKIMKISFRFSGFKTYEQLEDGGLILKYLGDSNPVLPKYVELIDCSGLGKSEAV